MSSGFSFAAKLAAFSLIGVLLQNNVVLAQGADATPITGVLEWFVELLQGSIARSLGIIAVCFFGFLAMTGRLVWAMAFSIVIGIACVFGAAELVDAIQGSAGGS